MCWALFIVHDYWVKYVTILLGTIQSYIVHDHDDYWVTSPYTVGYYSYDWASAYMYVLAYQVFVSCCWVLFIVHDYCMGQVTKLLFIVQDYWVTSTWL